MVFWGCSDVVESWAEHPILDAESRRDAALTSTSEQPRRARPLEDARTCDNGPVWRAGLLIDELSNLSIDRDQLPDQREQSETRRLEPLPGTANTSPFITARRPPYRTTWEWYRARKTV